MLTLQRGSTTCGITELVRATYCVWPGCTTLHQTTAMSRHCKALGTTPSQKDSCDLKFVDAYSVVRSHGRASIPQCQTRTWPKQGEERVTSGAIALGRGLRQLQALGKAWTPRWAVDRCRAQRLADTRRNEPRPNQVVNGQVTILLWRIRQTQHHDAPAAWPRPPMVDLVWLVFLSPSSAQGGLRSGPAWLSPPACQICHDDEDSMRSCRRNLARPISGRARGVHPPSQTPHPWRTTAGYSRVRIGTSGGAGRSGARGGTVYY